MSSSVPLILCVTQFIALALKHTQKAPVYWNKLEDFMSFSIVQVIDRDAETHSESSVLKAKYIL